MKNVGSVKPGYLHGTNNKAWFVMTLVGVIVMSWAAVSIFYLTAL